MLAVLADDSVVSTSWEATVRVLGLERSTALSTLKGHAGGVTAVAALADGAASSPLNNPETRGIQSSSQRDWPRSAGAAGWEVATARSSLEETLKAKKPANVIQNWSAT